MPAPVDIAGQRFGHLVALELMPPAEGNPWHVGRKWRCKCDCGTTSIARGTDLRFGNTISCGCVKRAGGHARWLRRRGRA